MIENIQKVKWRQSIKYKKIYGTLYIKSKLVNSLQYVNSTGNQLLNYNHKLARDQNRDNLYGISLFLY